MRQLKHLSLLLGLLLLGPSTYAQSVRYQSQAISSRGAGIANATIAVCTQPANTNTQPCSPLATLATSTSTTSGGANPLTADSFGNFFFYATPGRYTVQIYGPAVSGQFVIPDVVINCDPTASCAIGGPSPWIDITSQPYGAKCDGVTDDTTAINTALTAANTAGGGTVFVPSTKTCVAAGQIVLDLMSGVTFAGGQALTGFWNGGQGRPLIKLTGTSSPLVTARSTVSVRILGMNFQYTNAAFTGEVIGTEHTGTGCGGGGCDTNQFLIQDSSVAGTAGTATGAVCLVCLDKTIDSAVTRVQMDYAVNAIRGQSLISTYSINNKIEGNQMSISSGGVGTIQNALILNPGTNWKIFNNDFEFGLAASQPVSTPTGIDFTAGNCQGCSIDTNFLGDMPAGWTGTVFKNVLGPGISITNNQAVAGTSNLGTFATFNNGATGINVSGNVIQNYATAFNLTSAAVRDLNIQGNSYSNITTWMAGSSSLLGGVTVDPSFHTAVSDLMLGNAPNNRLLLFTQSSPSIAAAGCGGAAASIVRNNGTMFFTVNVGTTPGSACTITMPAASVGWGCSGVNDITTNSASVFLQKQTGADNPTSITITNFNTAGAATAFVASDIVKLTGCVAY